jgi:hypothetical protein
VILELFLDRFFSPMSLPSILLLAPAEFEIEKKISRVRKEPKVSVRGAPAHSQCVAKEIS